MTDPQPEEPAIVSELRMSVERTGLPPVRDYRPGEWAALLSWLDRPASAPVADPPIVARIRKHHALPDHVKGSFRYTLETEDVAQLVGVFDRPASEPTERERELVRSLAEANDNLGGARLLLAEARDKAAHVSSKADLEAWRRLNAEERRDGISPGPLAEAAEAAVAAWIDNERVTNPAWWPTWEEMSEIERLHRGNPLTDVIRRIVGLEHAPLSQVLDTLRFKYYACGPWRSRVLNKLKEARVSLQCETEDDVPAAARELAEERDALRAKLAELETRVADVNDHADGEHALNERLIRETQALKAKLLTAETEAREAKERVGGLASANRALSKTNSTLIDKLATAESDAAGAKAESERRRRLLVDAYDLAVGVAGVEPESKSLADLIEYIGRMDVSTRAGVLELEQQLQAERAKTAGLRGQLDACETELRIVREKEPGVARAVEILDAGIDAAAKRQAGFGPGGHAALEIAAMDAIGMLRDGRPAASSEPAKGEQAGEISISDEHASTLMGLHACAEAWERGSRLLGNVEAGAIADAVWALLCLLPRPQLARVGSGKKPTPEPLPAAIGKVAEALPTDAKDEKLVDEMMAKRDAGRKETRMKPAHTCINTCTTSDGSVPPRCLACQAEHQADPGAFVARRKALTPTDTKACTCWGRPWNPLQPFSHREDCPHAGGECRGCGKALLKANRSMADGCPCNSPRGVNHGLVPEDTCTCDKCDPQQTGSARKVAAPAAKPTPDPPEVRDAPSSTPAGSAWVPKVGDRVRVKPGAGGSEWWQERISIIDEVDEKTHEVALRPEAEGDADVGRGAWWRFDELAREPSSAPAGSAETTAEVGRSIERLTLHQIAVSMASFIAEIDSDSSRVAAYIEQRLEPLVGLAGAELVHRIADDARKLTPVYVKKTPSDFIADAAKILGHSLENMHQIYSERGDPDVRQTVEDLAQKLATMANQPPPAAPEVEPAPVAKGEHEASPITHARLMLDEAEAQAEHPDGYGEAIGNIIEFLRGALARRAARAERAARR